MTTSFAPDLRRPDAELVRASLSGDREAFRLLFERHVGAVRAYLVARLGPDAADDAVVETFTAAWGARAKFRLDADSARPWLYGIATVQAKRHRSAEQDWHRASLAERRLALAESPPEPHDPPELSRELAVGLAQLRPSEREILLLVALGDLTVAMAARAAGITAVAARIRLHRARKALTPILTAAASGDLHDH